MKGGESPHTPIRRRVPKSREKPLAPQSPILFQPASDCLNPRPYRLKRLAGLGGGGSRGKPPVLSSELADDSLDSPTSKRALPASTAMPTRAAVDDETSSVMHSDKTCDLWRPRPESAVAVAVRELVRAPPHAFGVGKARPTALMASPPDPRPLTLVTDSSGHSDAKHHGRPREEASSIAGGVAVVSSACPSLTLRRDNAVCWCAGWMDGW